MSQMKRLPKKRTDSGWWIKVEYWAQWLSILISIRIAWEALETLPIPCCTQTFWIGTWDMWVGKGKWGVWISKELQPWFQCVARALKPRKTQSHPHSWHVRPHWLYSRTSVSVALSWGKASWGTFGGRWPGCRMHPTLCEGWYREPGHRRWWWGPPSNGWDLFTWVPKIGILGGFGDCLRSGFSWNIMKWRFACRKFIGSYLVI